MLTLVLAATLVAAGTGGTSGPRTFLRDTMRVCEGLPTGSALASGWYVAPAAAVTDGEGAVVMGWPIFQFATNTRVATVLDSGAAGIVAVGGAPAVAIEQPVPGRLMENPKVRRRSARSVEVLFSATVGRPEVNARTDSLVLWAGRLEGTEWRQVNRVAQFPPRSLDHRQIVGDGVMYREELNAAVLEIASSSAPTRAAIVRGGGSQWRVEYPFPASSSVSYLDLAVYRDTLWLAAVAHVDDADGAASTFGIWLSFRGESAWSPPQLVVLAAQQSVREPRLLARPEELVLAWIASTDADSRLRWRSVGTTHLGTVNERPISTYLTRGAERFSDLVSTAVDDSIALILELTGSGERTLARVPTILGTPALVLGDADRPIAFAPALGGVDKPVPFWIAKYDLRCILPLRK